MVGKGRLDKNGRRLLSNDVRKRAADAPSAFLSIGDVGEKSSDTQREPIAGLPKLTGVSGKVERILAGRPECKNFSHTGKRTNPSPKSFAASITFYLSFVANIVSL